MDRRQRPRRSTRAAEARGRQMLIAEATWRPDLDSSMERFTIKRKLANQSQWKHELNDTLANTGLSVFGYLAISLVNANTSGEFMDSARANGHNPDIRGIADVIYSTSLSEPASGTFNEAVILGMNAARRMHGTRYVALRLGAFTGQRIANEQTELCRAYDVDETPITRRIPHLSIGSTTDPDVATQAYKALNESDIVFREFGLEPATVVPAQVAHHIK